MLLFIYNKFSFHTSAGFGSPQNPHDSPNPSGFQVLSSINNGGGSGTNSSIVSSLTNTNTTTNTADGLFEPPISDNSVSSTWSTGDVYSVPNEVVDVAEFALPSQPIYSDGFVNETFESNVAVVRSAGPDERTFRSKNVLRNNLKAIKSGLKTAAHWIPNIFNRTSSTASSNHRTSAGIDGTVPMGTTMPNGKKNQNKSKTTKLTRHDSINSSLQSNSFYSSVLGSEASNSQFTSNSYSTNSSTNSHSAKHGGQQQSYGQYSTSSVKSGQLARCTSYDPISLGESSRRSSEAIDTVSIASTNCSTNRSMAQQQPTPKHLNQTENLVIQPQSLALTNDHFVGLGRMMPPPPPPVQTMMPPNQIKPESQEPIDSINNLILPDDMV